MAKNNRLPEIEAERGELLKVLIPRLLNKHGNPYAVADELGVHANTILRWMKKEGVQRETVVRYVLPEVNHAH